MKRPRKTMPRRLTRAARADSEQRRAEPSTPRPALSSSFYEPPPFTEDELADVAAGTRLRVAAMFLGGFEVQVRPLGEPEIAEARAEARARVQMILAQHGLDDVGTLADEMHERMAERAIVVRATVRPGGPFAEPAPFFDSIAAVEALDASTVTTLFDAFIEAQRRACPARDADEAKQLADAFARERGTIAAARARFGENLCAFYGVPSVMRLTDWQVLYFCKLLENDS